MKNRKITLSDAYKSYFDIGVAINPGSLSSGKEMIRTEFSSVTCENEMKPISVQPKHGEYNFGPADMIADFAAENHLKVRGHTLVWHGQTGSWMYKDANGENLSKDMLYKYMKEHIDTVVKRYAGKVYCWDVVNEAVSDSDDEYLRTKSPYYEITGSEEFIEKAFTYAHEADPDALLFYNDYNTESPAKRERIYKLLKSLKDKGIPVHGIGLQGHYDIYFDVSELKKSISLFSSLGLTIHITELDVSIYRFDERGVDFKTPPEDRMKLQAELYEKIFALLRENKDKVSSVTFWGLNDGASWLNGFPVRRTNHALLLDRQNNPKEAYERVVNFKTDYQTPTGFDTRNNGIAYGELTELEYESKITGNTRKCFVCTPADYNTDITYPVLYLLHGIGGTHTEWLGGAPNEIISNLIGKGEAKPMIVVIPNIRASYDDSVPKEGITPENIAACDNFINDLRYDLMPFIKEHYSVSDKRDQCAVAGLSMGGREALFIGLKMPDTFGYIGAFSPAPGLLPADLPNDRQHKGQLTEEEMTLPEAYKSNTFILMCSGNEEEMFNHISASYQKAFSSNGIECEYYLTTGGHDFRTWKNGLYNFVKRIF